MNNEFVYKEATKRSSREKVRDGYLNDLPENVKTVIMNIHKLIKKTVDELIEDDHFEDLKDSRWAMSCIDDFCQMPKDKSEVGSVRVYQNRKTYRAMIQATGHFRNHEYGWIEELLHDFIATVHQTVRPIIRKKYDYTITNEGKGGEPFEGFDIYPPPKVAKELWELFGDRKTKTITENGEIITERPIYHQMNNYLKEKSICQIQLGSILEQKVKNHIDSLVLENSNVNTDRMRELYTYYHDAIESFEESIYFPEDTSNTITIEDLMANIQNISHYYLLENILRLNPDKNENITYDFLSSIYESTNIDELYSVEDNSFFLTSLIPLSGIPSEKIYTMNLFESVSKSLNSLLEDEPLTVDIVCENGYIGLTISVDDGIDIYTEAHSSKKSFEKKSIDDFKRKFNYTPDGYIRIDGRKYKVDMNFNSTLIKSKYGMVIGPKESICIAPYTWEGEKDHNDNYDNILEWQIILPQAFFNIKGNYQNRDSILYHEIGHALFQLDQKTKNSRSKEFNNERDTLRKYIKKFSIKSNYHVNEDEFEADRYAANKTSEKALFKALDKMDKYSSKPKNARKEIKIAKKELKKLESNRKNKMDEEEAEKLGLTVEEYRKFFGTNDKQEKEKLQREAYKKYCDDPKYPGRLSFEKFVQYFDIDEESLTYRPKSYLPKHTTLTKRGIARYEKEEENKINKQAQNGKHQDINRRKKAIKDEKMRKANYLKEDVDENISSDDEEFVTLFGVAKNYDKNFYYPDGTMKKGNDLSSVKFASTFGKLTRGDNYSHAVVSFNEDLTDMYSYEASGFVQDSIENGKWDWTDSIYICVMFVKKSDKERMRKEVERLTRVKDKTRYAYSNFVRGVLGQYRHYDTRFFCSAFSTYILQCGNLKNLHRDISVQRPEDLTILPRAFYVMNVKNKEDFHKKKGEFHSKIQKIYNDHINEIREYNSQLPKMMFQQKIDKLKTFDRIVDWFMRDVIGGNYA